VDKISVVTVSFRSAATIGDTLRSINEQTYPDLEYIVVDGGSNDDALAIVEREGKRVSKVVSEKDKGINDAYNKGLRLATGDIIGFLNSDDYYCRTDVIARVARVFEDPAVDICYSDLVYVDKDDTSKIVRMWKSRPWKPGLFRIGFAPAHPTVFFRRRVYEQVGEFQVEYRYAGDFNYMLRMFSLPNVKAVYVPEIWVKMRTGGRTGDGMAAIKPHFAEISRALNSQGVPYSVWRIFLYKIIDRSLQRVRARFVRLDGPGLIP
jgi:glycosyltransferase